MTALRIRVSVQLRLVLERFRESVFRLPDAEQRLEIRAACEGEDQQRRVRAAAGEPLGLVGMRDRDVELAANELHLGERHVERRAHLIASCLRQGLAAEARPGSPVAAAESSNVSIAAARPGPRGSRSIASLISSPPRTASPTSVRSRPRTAGATRTADRVGRVGQSERELGELGRRRMGCPALGPVGRGVELGRD